MADVFISYAREDRQWVEKLAAVLKAHGFDRPAKRDRIFIQSFYKEALLKMKELAPGYARVQLLPMETAGR